MTTKGRVLLRARTRATRFAFVLGLALYACAPAPPPGAPRGRVVECSIPAPRLPGGVRRALVYLPPSYDHAPGRRYPVVFLLHGGPGEMEDWFAHAHANGTFDALAAGRALPEVIAIAPDGHGPGERGRSLWANSADGRFPLEDFVVHDVVAWADTALRTERGAEHRALVGLSDGGDAAIGLLIRHGDVFGGGAGLSGRYHPHSPSGYEAIAGPPPGRDSMLCSLSALCASDSALAALGRRRARVYFDAGLFDLAWFDEVRLHARLRALRVPHEWHLYPGWHDWPFWRRRLVLALRAVVR